MLTVVCWKWNDPSWPNGKYKAQHVNILAEMVAANLKIQHRFVCVTDDARGIDLDIGIVPLWPDLADLGHCYRRLKIFDTSMKDLVGERIVSLDLDSVVTGDLTPLFDRPDDFVMLKDTQPPTPYNGSMFMMNAGARSKVWTEFQWPESRRRGAALGYAACDQAWIGACLGTNEKVWTGKDGAYSYRNEIQRSFGGKPPENSRIVFFHGREKPWDAKQQQATWIRAAYKTRRRRAIILGGGDCLKSDLEAYGPISDDVSVFVINDAGHHYPGRIDHWVSLHPEKLRMWRSKRKVGNQDYQVHAHIMHVDGGVTRATPDWGGSSGLLACKVALELGFDHIVLAGVPMQQTPHFFGGPKWEEAKYYQQAWEKHLAELIGKVFSMSGWTKELLNP